MRTPFHKMEDESMHCITLDLQKLMLPLICRTNIWTLLAALWMQTYPLWAPDFYSGSCFCVESPIRHAYMIVATTKVSTSMPIIHAAWILQAMQQRGTAGCQQYEPTLSQNEDNVDLLYTSPAFSEPLL